MQFKLMLTLCRDCPCGHRLLRSQTQRKESALESLEPLGLQHNNPAAEQHKPDHIVNDMNLPVELKFSCRASLYTCIAARTSSKS